MTDKQLQQEFSEIIYDLSKVFPKEEVYGLTNQMRRCAVSIPSNIAEGCGRQTAKDTINFLHTSRGSLYELETQCYVALDQKYIDENNFDIVFLFFKDRVQLLNNFNFFLSIFVK